MLTDPRTALGAAVLGGVGVALLSPQRVLAKDEVEIDVKNLPEKIRGGAEKMFPKVKWVQATKVTDQGEVHYELAGALPEKKLLVLEIDEDGDIFRIETETELGKVPDEVKTGFRKEYPAKKGWKIDAVFEVEEDEDGDDDFEVIGYEFHAIWQKPKGTKAKPPKDDQVEVFVNLEGKIEKDC